MTTKETIEFAKRLRACSDEYEAASLLINFEHEVQIEAIGRFSGNLQKGLTATTPQQKGNR